MGDEQISPALTGLIMENQEADPMTEPRHNQRPRPRFEAINREQMVMRVVDVGLERLLRANPSSRGRAWPPHTPP